MKDRLTETPLLWHEVNAKQFVADIREELIADFRDIQIDSYDWSQLRRRNLEGISKKARQKGDENLAAVFEKLAQEAKEEQSSSVLVEIVGNSRVRINEALFSLSEIAKRNFGVLDTEKSKSLYVNPPYKALKEAGIEKIWAARWKCEMAYKFTEEKSSRPS